MFVVCFSQLIAMCNFGLNFLNMLIFLNDFYVHLDPGETECCIYQTSLRTIAFHKSSAQDLFKIHFILISYIFVFVFV